MEQLIYTSSATDPFSAQQLADLLFKSRVFNKSHGLTGLLVYHEGAFLQILEGSEEAVSLLFSRIVKDSRHCNINVLLRGAISERHFGGGSMGFAAPEHAAAALAGWIEVNPGLPTKLKLDVSGANLLLHRFLEGEWAPNPSFSELEIAMMHVVDAAVAWTKCGLNESERKVLELDLCATVARYIEVVS